MSKSILFFLLLCSFPVLGEAHELDLPEISILGVPERRSPFDYLPTVSKLTGGKLDRKKEATLGETLSREVGISSSFFGPNASRPVIRGLDGDRVRMLENGIGLLDASGASPDHAVAVDPLLVESVEILRGPSALLYGSSAVGGVVNLRTNRISENGLETGHSDFQVRYSSVDQGKSLGGVACYKLGEYVFHVDGSIRSNENYEVPVGTGEVENSSNRTSQGAIGISRPFENGFAGISLSGYLTDYGTVAEETVRIGMDRVRLDAAGEIKRLAFFDSIRFKSAYTKYEHQERETTTGEVGTVFRNRGIESRVDAKSGGLTLGVQQQYFRMGAIGDEAFLPTTRNSSWGLFALQEMKWGSLKPSLGLRLDAASVTGEEGALLAAEVRKNFFAPSSSLGFQLDLPSPVTGQEWTLGLNSTYTERAPNYQELFANGTHMATGIVERGNASFSTEKNLGLELSLKAKDRRNEARFTTYLQDFRNYLALTPTGTQDDGGTPGDTSDDLDIYEFRATPARLFGAEFEFTHKLEEAFLSGNWEFEFKADWMRGLDLGAGGNLPRMVPARGTLGVRYQQTHFALDSELQRVEGQNVLAANEVATRGYTLLNLGAEVPVTGAFGNLKLLLRANNLLNVEARNHLSFLKQLAPLPGRNIVVGIQGSI
jgi:iron complex outermembrane receptor protein